VGMIFTLQYREEKRIEITEIHAQLSKFFKCHVLYK